MFHFVDVYDGSECPVCKRGKRIERQAYDTNSRGELHRVCVVRDKQRSRPAVMTVGYTSCTNPNCALHCDIGFRKEQDAKQILKQVRIAAYSGSKKKKRRRRR